MATAMITMTTTNVRTTMTRKILICQHVAHEILGTLNPLIKQGGFRMKYVNFERTPDEKPSLEGYSGMIILGGPQNMDETDKNPHLFTEINLVKDAIKRDIPVLGICLGAQIIAVALGAKVGPNPVTEIGWYDLDLTEEGKKDSLFHCFADKEKVFQWHGYTFDIPKGATHLAKGDYCENQAFRYGKNIYALQFHMEVDEPMIERWLGIHERKQKAAGAPLKCDPKLVQQDTTKNIDRLKDVSDKSFGEFLKLFGVEKKSKRLPSK
jgi:GMP synthase (glutamine-hydrolysing)